MFFLNIYCICVYLYIHNKYTRYTHIYIMYTHFFIMDAINRDQSLPNIKKNTMSYKCIK